MKQLTVFGASGKVGREVVALALERGYQVVAFVHSHDPFETNAVLQVVKGDVHDRSAVAAALAGSEAVISALGSWGSKEKNIVSSGMRTTIPRPAVVQCLVNQLETAENFRSAPFIHTA